MSFKTNRDVKDIIKMYCPRNAVIEDVQLEKPHRTCSIWSFKCTFKKWKYKHDSNFWPYRNAKYWSEVPDECKEQYTNSFYMAVSDFELEFEEEPYITLSDNDRSIAVMRCESEIDRQYQETARNWDIE